MRRNEHSMTRLVALTMMLVLGVFCLFLFVLKFSFIAITWWPWALCSAGKPHLLLIISFFLLQVLLIWIIFFHGQDLVGDVAQNLHEYFRALYKKVRILFLFWCNIMFVLCFYDNLCICRSLKLILKSLRQTIGDLILRRKIWLSSTVGTRATWTGISIVFIFSPFRFPVECL